MPSAPAAAPPRLSDFDWQVLQCVATGAAGVARGQAAAPRVRLTLELSSGAEGAQATDARVCEMSVGQLDALIASLEEVRAAMH